MADIQLKWYKVTKSGVGMTGYDRPGSEGVYISTVHLPYTMQQGTVEYHSWDSVVMPPVLCWSGHDRHRAFEEAKSCLQVVKVKGKK